MTNPYKDRVFSPVEEYAIAHIVEHKLTALIKFGTMWRLYIDGELKGNGLDHDYYDLTITLECYPNRKDRGKFIGPHVYE